MRQVARAAFDKRRWLSSPYHSRSDGSRVDCFLTVSPFADFPGCPNAGWWEESLAVVRASMVDDVST